MDDVQNCENYSLFNITAKERLRKHSYMKSTKARKVWVGNSVMTDNVHGWEGLFWQHQRS
jgi:hypothetical protein